MDLFITANTNVNFIEALFIEVHDENTEFLPPLSLV